MKAREGEASWAYMVIASALKDEAGRSEALGQPVLYHETMSQKWVGMGR